MVMSMRIAESTGKEHSSVMRDIRTTLEEAEIGGSKSGCTYFAAKNRARACFGLLVESRVGIMLLRVYTLSTTCPGATDYARGLMSAT